MGIAVSLGVPSAVFIVFSVGCVALYFKTRRALRNVLDSSYGARFVYFSVATVILPSFIGVWADVVDLSDLRTGKFDAFQLAFLSLIAGLTPLYLYVHACSFYRDEQLMLAVARVEAERNASQCQRNFLVHLLEHLRGSLGAYSRSIDDFLKGNSSPSDASDVVSPEKKQVPLVVDAILQTFKNIDEVPADASLAAVLFRADAPDSVSGPTRYLIPYYSFDGATRGYFDDEYHECRTHFDLTKPGASVAVAAACTKSVLVVENAEIAHSNPQHPFKFFADEQKQRSQIRSMVAIPFVDCVHHSTWVLCVSSNRVKTFRDDHLWKYEQTARHLEIRVNHLLRASLLLEAIKLEKQGLPIPAPHGLTSPTSQTRVSRAYDGPLD